MRNKTQEKFLNIFVFIITLVMIVLRFLLNEKGRVSPDSIRYMRFAHVFPVIDNTTTPIGYPVSIKFFTFFGFDEFWSSKIVGFLAYLLIIFFAWKKKFYFREVLLVGGLFSYVSIFSFTLSEPLILPFIFLFLYISRGIIIEKWNTVFSVLYLSLILIALYNIRYSAMFFMIASFLWGFLNFKKKFSKSFIISSLVGFIFIVGYQFLFINYFNEKYINQFLEIGLHPTPKLLMELFMGLATSFNPFIHIANPSGGIINYGIYGIGFLNIIFIIYLFIKDILSITEKFLVFVSVIGILCSYFIQYFYSVDALDYRLLTPFIFSVWLVYFKKLYQNFGKLVYGITIMSLITGFIFTWLSKGNYLENRKIITEFLKNENLLDKKIKYFCIEKEDINYDIIQVAELMSTVNPKIYITQKPEDTLNNSGLTKYKVESKIKINKNKYQ